MFKVPNEFRITTGIMASDNSIGNKGAFDLQVKDKKRKLIRLICICSDDLGWEHVSCYKIIRDKRYIPSWLDMCMVKAAFWDDEDCVMQLHPAKSNYVNNNPYVLHLWRPIGIEIPSPPVEMV